MSGATAELRSCVKIEVAVLGSPSLMVIMVSGCNSSIELVTWCYSWPDGYPQSYYCSGNNNHNKQTKTHFS